MCANVLLMCVCVCLFVCMFALCESSEKYQWHDTCDLTASTRIWVGKVRTPPTEKKISIVARVLRGRMCNVDVVSFKSSSPNGYPFNIDTTSFANCLENYFSSNSMHHLLWLFQLQRSNSFAKDSNGAELQLGLRRCQNIFSIIRQIAL